MEETRLGRILHFLRNFPYWIVLTPILIMFVVLYYKTGDVNFKEWTSWVLTSLFTSLGLQRSPSQPAQQTGTTDSGDINITKISKDNTTEPTEPTDSLDVVKETNVNSD